jgi:type IV secretion system protein VirB9
VSRFPLKILAAAPLLISALLLPATGLAATYPKPSDVDKRLRYTSYDPDQVYILKAAIGRACFIQFAEGEEMERYYTGDSDAWEVGKHANLVAIKPTAATPNTNLIIATTAGRVYTFDLSLSKRAPMYGVRFSYPNEERRRSETRRAKRDLAASLNPARQTQRNYRYAGAGSPAVQPVEIFDNGSHTFMKFAENQTFPTIFAVGADGEALVNKSVRGNWLIVPRVSREWRLRDGKEVLCVRNDAFAPDGRDNPAETTDPAITREAR